jgi:hypothetical protein
MSMDMGHSHILAVVNNATVNPGVQISLSALAFSYFGVSSKVSLLEYVAILF